MSYCCVIILRLSANFGQLLFLYLLMSHSFVYFAYSKRIYAFAIFLVICISGRTLGCIGHELIYRTLYFAHYHFSKLKLRWYLSSFCHIVSVFCIFKDKLFITILLVIWLCSTNLEEVNAYIAHFILLSIILGNSLNIKEIRSFISNVKTIHSMSSGKISFISKMNLFNQSY